MQHVTLKGGETMVILTGVKICEALQSEKGNESQRGGFTSSFLKFYFMWYALETESLSYDTHTHR